MPRRGSCFQNTVLYRGNCDCKYLLFLWIDSGTYPWIGSWSSRSILQVVVHNPTPGTCHNVLWIAASLSLWKGPFQTRVWFLRHPSAKFSPFHCQIVLLTNLVVATQIANPSILKFIIKFVLYEVSISMRRVSNSWWSKTTTKWWQVIARQKLTFQQNTTPANQLGSKTMPVWVLRTNWWQGITSTSRSQRRHRGDSLNVDVIETSTLLLMSLSLC